MAGGNDIWSHRLDDSEREEKKGKSYCQFAAIIGNHSKGSSLTKDDFYTMTLKDSDGNKGIRNKNVRKDDYIVYEFDTDMERDNFLNYCKTFFARFCLSIFKNSQNNHYGEMSLIPWLDFTQSWDDAKLFKHFNIDKKTQEYIYNFLPDLS